MNTTDIHRERDRQRAAIVAQFEDGARDLVTSELGEQAIVSIAISLRRLADVAMRLGYCIHEGEGGATFLRIGDYLRD